MPPVIRRKRETDYRAAYYDQLARASELAAELQKLHSRNQHLEHYLNAEGIPPPTNSLAEWERDRQDLERYRKNPKATEEAIAIRAEKLQRRKEALDADSEAARAAYAALLHDNDTLRKAINERATPQVVEVQKPCPKCQAVEDQHIETQLRRWFMGITHTLPAHLHELEKQRDFTKARAMRKWPELFETNTPELPAPKSFTARWVDQD